MSTATPTFVPRLDLWADRDGMIHYVVPTGTYVTDENARVFAGPGKHVYGHRRPQSIQLRATSAIACDYCAAMRKIATMGGV